MHREISGHAGEPIDLGVRRGDAVLTLRATPDDAGKLRVSPAPVTRVPAVGEALASSLAEPAEVLVAVARGLKATLSAREKTELVGPVGIVRETGRAQMNAGARLRFAASVNAYFIGIPILVALAAFPWRRRSKVSGASA
jgi:hypothetical protein